MLVMSRTAGTSIVIGSTDENCLITVPELFPERGTMSTLINRASTTIPGKLDARTIEVKLDTPFKIGQIAAGTLVELRPDKVRVQIDAGPEVFVHRLEVYEEIRRKGRPDGGENPNGGAIS